MKQFLKKLLPKKALRVVITFDELDSGQIHTTLKMDKAIPAGSLLHTLDKIKWDVQTKLTRKVKDAGLNRQHPKTGDFIKRQRLGDIM
jgi:hypothetical protein